MPLTRLQQLLAEVTQTPLGTVAMAERNKLEDWVTTILAWRDKSATQMAQNDALTMANGIRNGRGWCSAVVALLRPWPRHIKVYFPSSRLFFVCLRFVFV